MICLNPYTLRNNNMVGRTALIVPCGRCISCKKRRASAWAFRLMQEDKIATSSHFVTLTYNDDNLPMLSPMAMMCKCRYREGFYGDQATLCRCDMQKFFKRLRKNTGKKLRYYAVGEYGTDTKRPHYHAIMYNCSSDDIFNAWHVNGKILGQVKFGDTHRAAIQYVTNYLNKSSDYDPSPSIREFSLMSKGIGKNYLTDAIVDWHMFNAANYTVLPGGEKGVLPRYYKDRIFDEDVRRAFGEEAEAAYYDAQMKRINTIGYEKWLHESKTGAEALLKSLEYRSKMRNKL